MIEGDREPFGRLSVDVHEIAPPIRSRSRTPNPLIPAKAGIQMKTQMCGPGSPSQVDVSRLAHVYANIGYTRCWCAGTSGLRELASYGKPRTRVPCSQAGLLRSALPASPTSPKDARGDRMAPEQNRSRCRR